MATLYLFPPDDNTSMKTCTGTCGRMLPATSEYFHAEKYGDKVCLRNVCKECRRKNARDHYHKPEVHERRLSQAEEYRKSPEGQVYRRNHHKEWSARPETKEYKRNYTRSYRMRPGVMERKQEWDKEYNLRPETREHRRPLERVWSSTRRARKRDVGGTYTHQQIEDLLKRQKCKCYYCHTKFKKNKDKYIYHIDHVIPLVRGGSNDISNLVLACPHCNQRKHDKLPHEWPDGGRLC